uniref:Phosphoesterase n=1 Tax=Ignisphaera aggregans TaxID=334771 RepID=A0A7J3QEV0_9CREN
MSRNINEISSMANTYKSLYIVYSPILDSIYTASLLLRALRDVEAEIQLAPFYTAQKPISSGVVLGIGILQKTSLSGSRFMLIDDFIGRDPKSFQSYSLYLLRIVKNIWIVPKPIEALALSSMLSLSKWSLYDEKLFEAHRQLLTEAISGDIWDYITTLRLFGYPKRDLMSALIRTIDPYIPGISFDEEGSRRVLQIVSDKIDEEGKKKLQEELTKNLSAYIKNAPSILGGKIIVKGVEGFEDPYEVTYALYTYMDLKGSEPLLYLSLDTSIMSIAIGRYVNTIRLYKNLIDEIIKGQNIRRVIVKGVRLGVIDISSEGSIPPLYTVHRILRALGIADELTVYMHGNEYLLPVQFMEPRWPFDKEVNIERNYAISSSLQDIGELVH